MKITMLTQLIQIRNLASHRREGRSGGLGRMGVFVERGRPRAPLNRGKLSGVEKLKDYRGNLGGSGRAVGHTIFEYLEGVCGLWILGGLYIRKIGLAMDLSAIRDSNAL